MMTYRNDLGKLYSYDWISVPLVYTQVTHPAMHLMQEMAATLSIFLPSLGLRMLLIQVLQTVRNKHF